MLPKVRRFQYSGVALVLLLLIAGVGCRGFFVNPTLTSLTIGPESPTISQGKTFQMSATGTYDDGSTNDLTGKAVWTSDNTSCATISSGGLITAATTVSATCTTDIGASVGTVSASSTAATVTPGTLSSIALTVSTSSPVAGSTLTFTAKGTYTGTTTQQDITTLVTWNNDNTSALTLTQGTGSASVSSSGSGQVAHVSATLSNITSNVVTITVQ